MDALRPASAQSLPSSDGGTRPLAGAGRIELLDVVRGVAVFGILLVNMPLFFTPGDLERVPDVRWFPGLLDQTVEHVVMFLAQGKFYVLFSFLFGVGLAIQAERVAAGGARPRPLLVRRMAGLLVFGAAHALLVWYGDILVMYAVLGWVAIGFLGRPRESLVHWSAALLVAPLVLVAAMAFSLATLSADEADEVRREVASGRVEALAAVDAARRGYAEGSPGEIFEQRWLELGAAYRSARLYAPQILGLVLAGMALGGSGLLRDPARLRAAASRVLGPSLVVGVVANVVLIAAQRAGPGDSASPATLLPVGAFFVGGPALGLAYAAAITRAVGSGRLRGPVRRVAAVGRMALTHYLTHSLVFTTLAYGYGFGLYGRVSPTSCLVLTVAMYSFQLWISPLWLRRFRFGPAEWLWRRATYGGQQP